MIIRVSFYLFNYYTRFNYCTGKKRFHWGI